MHRPSVSVCLATYNGDKFLQEQLNSIISQLNPEDEIIISDDGSEDSTLDIIHKFNDHRIKIFHNYKEHGYTPNFENASCSAMQTTKSFFCQIRMTYGRKTKLLNRYGF